MSANKSQGLFCSNFDFKFTLKKLPARIRENAKCYDLFIKGKSCRKLFLQEKKKKKKEKLQKKAQEKRKSKANEMIAKENFVLKIEKKQANSKNFGITQGIRNIFTICLNYSH